MSRNGAGVYSLPTGNPVVTGTTIQSTWANNTLTDIATALTGSIAADGQTPVSANIPFGNFKITTLGAGTAATDGTNLRQVQYQAYSWAGNAGGTANALTLTMTPTIGAYAAGQRFVFKATAINTGAATVAIDALAAVAIQFNGSALVGNEIQTGEWYALFFDTATTCQLSAITSPSLLNPPVTIASATSTPIGLGLGASNQVTISGTTTITSFDTIAAGTLRYVTYSGAVPITYDATKMQLVGAASRTYAVGDVSIFESLGAGNWKEIVYQPISGLYNTTTASTKLSAINAVANTPANGLTISMTAQYLDYRSATAGSGAISTIHSAPADLVISSGSTLGTVNAVQSDIAVLAINDAGTIRLGVVNMSGGVQLDETNLVTTTAEGGAGAADTANVIYTTTAVATPAPYRVVGIVRSTQATAGTWVTAPSLIQGAGGNALTAMSSLGYGQTMQLVTRASGTTYYNTTGKMIILYAAYYATSGSATFTPVIGGYTLNQSNSAGTNLVYREVLPIPAGFSYSFTLSGTGATVVCSELR